MAFYGADTAHLKELSQQRRAGMLALQGIQREIVYGAISVSWDEELTALDGLDTEQIVPMPWLSVNQEEVPARTAAAVSLRSEEDPTAEDPPLQFVEISRDTAAALLSELIEGAVDDDEGAAL